MNLRLRIAGLSLELQWNADDLGREFGFAGTSAQYGEMRAGELPLCPACQELPPEASSAQDHYREVRHLTDPKDLEGYEIATTNTRHTIPENKLLALYTFRQRVPCSNPGRHLHLDGLLVQARCGLVLAMGNDCGSQLVENFKRIDEVARRAREYNRFLPDTAARIAKLRAQYNAALKFGRGVIEFREFLRRELPWFSQDVAGARDESVAGRDLFDPQRVLIDRGFGDLVDLEWERQKWESDLPGIKAQREISARLRTLEERLNDFENWARRAAVLMTRSGFDRAMARIDSELQTVHVEEFSPSAGRMVQRQREIRTRTRIRAESSDEGIVDRISGRTLFVDWLG